MDSLFHMHLVIASFDTSEVSDNENINRTTLKQYHANIKRQISDKEPTLC